MRQDGGQDDDEEHSCERSGTIPVGRYAMCTICAVRRGVAFAHKGGARTADDADDDVHLRILFAHVALGGARRAMESLGLVGERRALVLEYFGFIDVGKHHLDIFLPA